MRFRIATNNVSGIKEYLIQTLRKQMSYKELYALNHINFNVYRGEIVGVIGLPATVTLVKSFGGTGFYLTRNGLDYERVVSAVGEVLAKKLTEYYQAAYFYLPKCDVALRVLRNRAFNADFLALTESGKSGRAAMIELCQKYKLSDRHGWEIVYSFRRTPTHKQAMLF